MARSPTLKEMGTPVNGHERAGGDPPEPAGNVHHLWWHSSEARKSPRVPQPQKNRPRLSHLFRTLWSRSRNVVLVGRTIDLGCWEFGMGRDWGGFEEGEVSSWATWGQGGQDRTARKEGFQVSKRGWKGIRKGTSKGDWAMTILSNCICVYNNCLNVSNNLNCV